MRCVRRDVFDFRDVGQNFLSSLNTISCLEEIVAGIYARDRFTFVDYRKSCAFKRLLDNAELLGRFLKLIECLFQNWESAKHVRIPSVYENFVSNMRAELLNKRFARYVVKKPADGLFGDKRLVLCPDSLFGVDFDDNGIRSAWYGFNNALGLSLAMLFCKHRRAGFVDRVLWLFTSSIKALAVFLFGAVNIPWDLLNRQLMISDLYKRYLFDVFGKKLLGLDFGGGIVRVGEDPRRILDWGHGVLGILREFLPECSFDIDGMRRKGVNMQRVFELFDAFLRLWGVEYDFDIERLVEFRIEKNVWHGVLDFKGAVSGSFRVELINMDDILFLVAMNRFEEGLLDLCRKIDRTIELVEEIRGLSGADVTAGVGF